MCKGIVEIGLSGWLTAVIFSFIVTILINKSNEKIELKSAKSSLKFEMEQNLDFFGSIYWEYENHGNHDVFLRDLHYANISLFPSYAGIILKNYPEIGSEFMKLFSAFDEIIKTKKVICTHEDAWEYIQYAKNINNKLSLGIDNSQIDKILKNDYSIR
jgi:hypothetical protein